MNSKILKLVRPILPKNKYGDKLFSIIAFLSAHNKWPSLRLPETFNEHILNLKLSPKSFDPLLGFITDKEYFKIYARAQIGNEYITRTIKILDSIDGISNTSLPAECVIKPTHLSNEIIVKTGNLDIRAFQTMNKWFRENHYLLGRERNYKYLQPKIIVEELLSGINGDIPKDYKIFCFKGEPRIIQVDIDRFSKRSRRFYDEKWEKLNFTILYEKGPGEPKPEMLPEMLKISRKLSKGFQFVRVDLYITTKGIKVGEMTFFPENCQGKFIPAEADLKVGKLFDYPQKKFHNKISSNT